MTTAKILGNRLKEARKNAGYTQKQAGAFFNIHQQAYARYESGAIELSYDKLKTLCIIFDVSADYLLGLEDEAGRKVTTVKNNFTNFNNNGNVTFN